MASRNGERRLAANSHGRRNGSRAGDPIERLRFLSRNHRRLAQPYRSEGHLECAVPDPVEAQEKIGTFIAITTRGMYNSAGHSSRTLLTSLVALVMHPDGATERV